MQTRSRSLKTSKLNDVDALKIVSSGLNVTLVPVS